jgi:hypothetical protein
VSNRGMRQTILIVTSLLLTCCPCAQDQAADQMERGAIERVKTLLVSSFDRSLSKAMLEFFLKYEGEGAIKWEVNDCGEQTGRAAVDHGRDSPMCVEAAIDLKDGHAATVLVSVGTFKRGPVDVPAVLAVRITDHGLTLLEAA